MSSEAVMSAVVAGIARVRVCVRVSGVGRWVGPMDQLSKRRLRAQHWRVACRFNGNDGVVDSTSIGIAKRHSPSQFAHVLRIHMLYLLSLSSSDA